MALLLSELLLVYEIPGAAHNSQTIWFILIFFSVLYADSLQQIRNYSTYSCS